MHRCTVRRSSATRSSIRLRTFAFAAVVILSLGDSLLGHLFAQGQQLGFRPPVPGLSELPPPHDIALDGFAAVTARSQDRRFLGLAVGGLVLGTAGALLVHWACINYSPEAPGTSCAPQTVAGGGVGAAVGGLLGYLVGLGIRAGGDAH